MHIKYLYAQSVYACVGKMVVFIDLQVVEHV
jgi:hypothetical protein